MSMETYGKLTVNEGNVISRPDPRKINSSSVGDPWFRKCPICHKVYSIVTLAQTNNRTPCCQVRILA